MLIDINDEYQEAYLIDIAEVNDGVMTLIISHSGDFEEDTIDIVYDPSSGEIVTPDIRLL